MREMENKNLITNEFNTIDLHSIRKLKKFGFKYIREENLNYVTFLKKEDENSFSSKYNRVNKNVFNFLSKINFIASKVISIDELIDEAKKY